MTLADAMLLIFFIMNDILIKFDDGTPITLEQMLLAKEKRVQSQQEAIKRYHYPLISLSLVIPGPIKNSSGANRLFKEAIATIHSTLSKNDISLIHETHFHHITGCEAIIVAKCSADILKQCCINIEDNHPLGRLWDIDVIDPITQQSISRAKFDHHSRQCLVCQQMAKVCSRSRKHTIDEVFSAIKKITNDYFSLPMY
ncbi:MULTISPECIES: citrate lyase holo-[acyl-carrier protein] synthase [unclassified Gilliamella]|uniref:citrate lyase holo-[acyl-carrier protein] synthase n=1 Tax=unclassified Gilliamella TaxID=2685620 RepID=UPI0013229EEF|nr:MULTISPECIES: citrate lyase holo-[acyl-carrier protein] synthase [unclassified Gilliamella]MWN31524.1 citrate lyase holo-[acyl-carrier protein] synthase [Gilliamella sp. Pra-s60]MWP28631.1 citrate lyase holo-[acyl-carrier protein] synthase [Gilliamella sp. Pra-s54]